MKKSIYKITNQINGKVYIGQSKDPYKRFKEHRYNHKEYVSLINLAIYKYGVENFTFEILEEEIENYNEREKYWINYYQSNDLTKGYNLTPGGEEPPIWKGIENYNTTHTEEQVSEVKRLLEKTEIPLEEIAEKCGYADRSAIERINTGIMWRDENRTYPIRILSHSDIAAYERWKQIVWYLQNSTLTQKEIGERVGVGRTTVTAINRGQNGQQWNDGSLSYPIRSGRHYNNNL